MIAALLLVAGMAPAPPTLEPFAPFVGSCWAADFTPTMRDTHCFELMYGGAHVRDRHQVVEAGKTVYAGETVYSVDGGGIGFVYFNSLGGVGRGTLTAAQRTIRFRGSIRSSPEKEPQPIDSQWRLLDDDHYDVRSLVESASTGGIAVLHFSREPERR